VSSCVVAERHWLADAAMIAKTFLLAKLFRAIRTKSLRDKKSFRDHGQGWGDLTRS
jgi:hypothetical protein